MLLRDRTLHRLAALRAAAPKSAEEEQRRKDAATTQCGDDGPVIEAETVSRKGTSTLLAAPAAPTLALRITMGTAKRAAASGTGARPKAAIDGPAAEERRRRQEDERKREAFEELQSSYRLKDDAEDLAELQDEEDFDDDEGENEEELRKARLEKKRKREEWRKAWKQEKREKEARARQEEQDQRRELARQRPSRDDDMDDPRKRAKMWGALNRDVRTILPKTTIQGGRSPGQISDADLDLRLRSRAGASGGERLMSEAEVLEKLNRDRSR